MDNEEESIGERQAREAAESQGHTYHKGLTSVESTPNQNQEIISAPDTTSKYLPEMNQIDLSEFFTLFGENADACLEKIEELKDKYYEALQKHQELDENFNNILNLMDIEKAKRDLATHQDEIDHYSRMFAFLKRYAHGTPFESQIPDTE